jgi:GNAT superfamily N-acetyltransferase
MRKMKEPIQVTIREYEARDAESVKALIREKDRLYQKKEPNVFSPDTDEYRSDDELRSTFFIAESDGNVVGVIELNMIFVSRTHEFNANKNINERNIANVLELVVKEGYRGNGIGQMLLEKGVEWAKSKGADDVEVMVFEFNKEAQKLSKKLGFRTLHRTLSLAPSKLKTKAKSVSP